MNAGYTLSDFNRQFFWQKPPEGMFQVDIGLNEAIKLDGWNASMPESQKQVPLPDLHGQYIVQFSDITSDMFTDIITVDKSGKIIIIHIFDSLSSNYS